MKEAFKKLIRRLRKPTLSSIAARMERQDRETRADLTDLVGRQDEEMEVLGEVITRAANDMDDLAVDQQLAKEAFIALCR